MQYTDLPSNRMNRCGTCRLIFATDKAPVWFVRFLAYKGRRHTMLENETCECSFMLPEECLMPCRSEQSGAFPPCVNGGKQCRMKIQVVPIGVASVCATGYYASASVLRAAQSTRGSAYLIACSSRLFERFQELFRHRESF